MKTSIMILYIVITAVIVYLIYKAYTNYGLSGSIFSTTPFVTDTNSVNRITYYNTNPQRSYGLNTGGMSGH